MLTFQITSNQHLVTSNLKLNNEKTYQKRRRGDEDPLESPEGIH